MGLSFANLLLQSSVGYVDAPPSAPCPGVLPRGAAAVQPVAFEAALMEAPVQALVLQTSGKSA